MVESGSVEIEKLQLVKEHYYIKSAQRKNKDGKYGIPAKIISNGKKINNLEYEKNYRFNHRKELNTTNKKWKEKNKLKVFIALKNKCANPYNIDHSAFEKDIDYISCLQIDHINGGGVKQLKGFHRSVSKFYSYVLSHLSEYQLLCPTCNWLKKIKNNEVYNGNKIIK